jgi:hypothetical protein
MQEFLVTGPDKSNMFVNDKLGHILNQNPNSASCKALNPFIELGIPLQMKVYYRYIDHDVGASLSRWRQAKD